MNELTAYEIDRLEWKKNRERKFNPRTRKSKVSLNLKKYVLYKGHLNIIQRRLKRRFCIIKKTKALVLFLKEKRNNLFCTISTATFKEKFG